MIVSVELIDLIPNSMTFRIVATLDLDAFTEVPAGYTGRVRRHVDERMVSVAWYHHGLLHNPSRSNPAYRCFRLEGQVKYEMWYEHGSLHDPSGGHAAVTGFYADGSRHYEEHWSRGIRQDGADGSAAIRKWRADGSLRHELRYRQGNRVA